MSDAEEVLPSGFYDRPVLVIESGVHTAPITCADVDAVGRFAVTASGDKTVRVWSLTEGALLRTIRLPSAPGEIGKAFAVAIDPTGAIIAAGGWTHRLSDQGIYLYDAVAGTLRHRISGLPAVVLHLAFSRDGRFLALTLHGPYGLRVFDIDRGWAEVARDPDYGGQSYGATFAPDGSLATTSYDGMIRLYPPGFALPPLRQRAPGGARPLGIAFSADGARLAVGYQDSRRVDVLDGRGLAPLHTAATESISSGDLAHVTWAADGTLLAGGGYVPADGHSVLAWEAEGRSTPRYLPAGLNTVVSLVPLPDGDTLIATADPALIRVRPNGAITWMVPSFKADFRRQSTNLAVAADGAMVEFGFLKGGRERVQFHVARLALTSPSPLNVAAPPRLRGLPIAGGRDNSHPTLGGKPLPLDPFEVARSLALHPVGDRFVLGTHFALRAFDRDGTQLWRQSVPGTTEAVNITGDGRLVVAAYGDGTIRWHRMDDGREILAFMPLADRRNWVVWTPEGFYAASPGAHGLLRWHVNQPGWQPAKDYAIADIPGFHRPEAIKRVLREMETPRAIGLAVVAEQRRKVQLLTNSRVPPGARLHLLAIGVNRYDAAHLRLEFAQQDAHDVVSALTSTQDALYTLSPPQYLVDADATRASIRRALETLRSAVSGPHDLAVVHFSGHGAMVDGELFLLPQDVRAGDAVALKDSALPVATFRADLTRVAERGSRVLVLLDACYSGGASADGSAQAVASNVLSAALAATNISVLTSSSASQTSREDPAWRNGAFTEAVLEALGPDADTNHDGLISATELAAYVARRVPALTEGRQTPGMEIRFDGTLFAVR
ncbi:caspase family protein [Paracraurococcus lichenis]|uniref:Caspase family protein n=1 Tax=Paracraurococcus lichenis TaxID=3064888 RepID=A0ABT9EB79_9PROT|nr:caspase family protein [Paracraurococcus sp. LOR1-02]MDO9713454.1 caspase family protein [Paracraurococcus sp. LOR1-02]